MNCTDAASGIVTLSKRPSGALVYRTATYWEWGYQMLHQYNSTSWW